MKASYFLVVILVLLSCCIDGAGEGMDCCDEVSEEDVGYVCENCNVSITYEMMKFSSFAVLENKSKADFCCFCCMMGYFDGIGNHSAISKAFVADYEALDWVPAQEAVYVRDVDITTPMNCGIVAFRTHETALEFKEEHGGEILSFHELLGNTENY